MALSSSYSSILGLEDSIENDVRRVTMTSHTDVAKQVDRGEKVNYSVKVTSGAY